MKTVIFGTSRHGNVVRELLQARGDAELIGFLDDNPARHGEHVAGIPVLGGTQWAEAHRSEGLSAVVAIGNNDARVAVSNRLRGWGFRLLNAIHPTAIILGDVTMCSGVVVCAGAIVVTGTRLENDVVVNTGASIDHDSVVREGAYVAPGVRTAGCVDIGSRAFVGLGALLGPGVSIGVGAVVGAGSVVLADVQESEFVAGAPATAIRKLDSVNWPVLLGGKPKQ
jgi:sugar O-acyltransferase (sialic acid O-acetyltransferase NeuD family)